MSVSELNKSLAQAVDLFVMTKFSNCFKICTNVINKAKCEPEQERNQEVIEAATALGIQALAETDLWHQVVAFINETYGSIEHCPPRIIQVCILLHAHVKEYLPCHKIVQMWLSNPHNLNHEQCSKVIRIYAHHILCPTGSYETLKEIVHSCKSLTEAERTALLQLPQAVRYNEAKRRSLETCNEGFEIPSQLNTTNSLEHLDKIPQHNSLEMDLPTDSQLGLVNECNSNKEQKENISSTTTTREGDKNIHESKLMTACRTICNLIKNCVWHRRSFHLIVMATFALWSVIQTQTADPVSSLGRLVTLWRVFLHRLGAFFAGN
ncbi:peroxisome assembly protein 26-like [Physella acuta]|uniref:peroxisome assembly protein 26-like n=1 Tax=Physella acuta TaxID=109671 RepID=UPI0027DE47F1|nr:peroxisome assembly protein 26-like [Physella acuta]XP_059153632.1 peroxisome assembly protein 26-like [Physella acuta]